MISVQEAKHHIAQKVGPLQPKLVPLNEALGRTLAADVYAQMDIPSFIQSSVDGYAFSFGDHKMPLPVTCESAAGLANPLEINSSEAARIFTGAPLPAGADTVVMQEYCKLKDGLVTIDDAALQPGDNVRPQGAEIKADALAMERGERITPAAIGFLAGIGIAQIQIYPAPTVTIIVTGKEIQQPGTTLAFGQVYDANSVMLSAALQAAQIDHVNLIFVDDTLDEVTTQLEHALQQSDLVLLTGGISVGDYDFVLQATKNCDIQQHFHRVKQKPGKPLYFGTKGDKLVFGLPGNPSSSLTCFYEYVLPALDAILQRPASISITSATLKYDYSKKAGLTHFLKGYVADGRVELLSAQESFRLASYAKANCLIVFEEAETHFSAGQPINIHII